MTPGEERKAARLRLKRISRQGEYTGTCRQPAQGRDMSHDIVWRPYRRNGLFNKKVTGLLYFIVLFVTLL
jgi:hypothetical protein